RRYAEALLATVDFAAELQRPCLPPGACTANRGARLLHRRLIGIIHAERPTRLRGAIRAAAVGVLLTQPVLVAATVESGVKSQGSEIRSQESGVRSQKPTVRGQAGSPKSRPPLPPKSTEPPAWATAPAPGGAVTAEARDHEV